MRLLYLANIRVPSEKAHTFQIMRMCAGFASAGAEVTLLVPDRKNSISDDPFQFYGLPKNFTLIKLRALDTIPIRWLPGYLALGLSLLSFVHAARRYAATAPRFDVCYTREAWLLPLVRGCGRMLAYESHNLPGRGQAWFRRGLRAADVVIATSGALAEELTRRGARSVVVERNGVDAARFAVPRRPHDGKKTVLYTGQLQEWKGIRTLLAASRNFPEDVRLALVGGAAADIARWKREVPGARAEFAGQRPHDEMPALLAAADVCIVPNSAVTRESVHFTSPIKLFEYLASGCPVVASDLPAIREIVDESMVQFFTPDDPVSLAAAISSVLRDPTAAKARAARGQELARTYEWDARARRIIKMLI